MDDILAEYIARCCTPEDDYLHRLWRATQTHLLYPRMASGHVQGRLLKLFVQLTRARRILEIGTYSGYSALAMASGMEEGGIIDTYEINDEQEDFTRPWLEGSPYAGQIRMHIGDVLDLLPEDGEPYDLVFIDADKRRYIDYYHRILPRVHPGSLLLADNTLWSGHVVDPHRHDAQTEGIRAFNDCLAKDPRVDVVMLPLRDGLTAARVK